MRKFFRKSSKLLFVLSVSASVFAAANVSAQTERLPGVIDRDPAKLEIERKVKPQGDSKPLEEAPWLENVENPAQPVATINSVVFKGNSVLDEEVLQEIAKPYLNRKITKADLAKLKYDVAVAFYERGYILVKPVTGPQDISNGVLTIEVYEAQVGDININDPEGVLNRNVSEAMASRASNGDVFYEKTTESLVSDINNLKNVNATVALSPGKQFKTTDLNLLITKADEDVQWVSVDNYGSDLTGNIVGTAHLEKSNMLKWGESFYSDLRRSDGNLRSALVGVDAPIALKNIHFDLNALHSENDIGDRLASLDASGKTDAINASFYSDILNTRKDRVTFRTGIEARTHESFLTDTTDTKDDLRKIYATASTLHRDIDSVVYAEAKLSKGIDIFDANEKGDLLATRIAGEPDAWIFNPLFIMHYRPDFEITEQNGTIKLLASGQLSSNTLLSSDLFVLGGYGSVRGFQPAQATGESGYQFNLEYSHILPTEEDWEVSTGPFFDGGAVYNRLEGQVLDNHLYSAGWDLEAGSAKIVPVEGETRFIFDVAFTADDYSNSNIKDTVAYFRVKQSFGK